MCDVMICQIHVCFLVLMILYQTNQLNSKLFRKYLCYPTFFQGHKEWLTEVNVLGIVEHPNLVKLVGYCAEDDERGIQRLLIYEYMPNRSVLGHLSPRSTAPLPWALRLRIALDAARGLCYLHEEMEFQVKVQLS